MATLGKCDLCDKEARWAVVVSGCSEHKIALKAVVDSACTNTASDAIALCKRVEESVGKHQGIGHLSLAELVDEMCEIAQRHT